MNYRIKIFEQVFIEFKDENNALTYRRIPTATWNHALYIVETLSDRLGVIAMGVLLRYILKDRVKLIDASAIILAAVEYKKHSG